MVRMTSELVASRIRFALRVFALLSVGLVLSSAAFAQSESTTPSAHIAGYQGPDRIQKLIEGAKKEGTLTFYASASPDDLLVLAEAFERKYGIAVRTWRASSESLVQRAVAEGRAGRFDADIFESGAIAMESLHRERLLQEVRSPQLMSLLPEAIQAHREWTGVWFNILINAYNTRLITANELPKAYGDLLNSKWKGKLAVEAGDFDWFAAVVAELGEDKGLQLFRDIVAMNGLSVRRGHTLLANMVVSGEVPLALTILQDRAEQLKNNGAPIDWFVIPPAVARLAGLGVARSSLRPNAAVLFFDFMLTDAQEILVARGYLPTSSKFERIAKKNPLKLVDAGKLLDESNKWRNLYRDITNQSR
jgi:iron(III) transport system substrate-binding protein